MNSPTLRVSIVVEESIDADASEALLQIVSEQGVDATLEPTWDDGHEVSASWMGSRRKAFRADAAGMFQHDPRWVIILYAAVNDLATRLGPTGLKDLVGTLWTTRTRQTGSKGTDGLVMLVDEETGIRAVLERDLPNDAYDILTDIDFGAFRSDPLQFFRDRGRHGRWRSPDNVSGTG